MIRPAKILIPATALALAAQLTVAFAGGVPYYNLAPLCRGITQQGGIVSCRARAREKIIKAA